MMWKVDEFSGVIELLKHVGRTDRLPQVMQTQIRTLRQLLECEEPYIQHICGLGKTAVIELVNNHKPLVTAPPVTPSSTVRRTDFPSLPCDIHVRANKRLAVASTANESTKRVALANLEADEYANSSKDPRLSLWRTWQFLAANWHLEPLPLTPTLVRALGASFKQGKYKSVKNYFSLAKQKHIEYTGNTIDDITNLTIQKVQRSVLRGLGQSNLKTAFDLEQLAVEQLQIPGARPDDLQLPLMIRDTGFHLVVLGSWFLTRGIELAAAEVLHLRIDKDKNTVSWLLPVSKTDWAAAGTIRTHGCCCQGERKHKLCPFHVAVDYIDKLRRVAPPDFFEVENHRPLFPSPSAEFLSKDQMITVIRTTLSSAQIQVTTTDQSGREQQLFAQHCLRVAGAQFLARKGVDLYVIQVLGRWGSRAVERYVQDAPITRLRSLAQQVLPPCQVIHSVNQSCLQAETEKNQLQELLERVIRLEKSISNPKPPLTSPTANMWVFNPRSKFAHRNMRETMNLQSEYWQTLCGWRYSTSNFTHCMQLPANSSICSDCNKKLARVAPAGDEPESEEAESVSE